MIRRPPRSTLFPTRRSSDLGADVGRQRRDLDHRLRAVTSISMRMRGSASPAEIMVAAGRDRKSTRLNSSHVEISYAVFCLKKKKLRLFRSLEPPDLNEDSVF